MSDWIDSLLRQTHAGTASVLISVISTNGSCPRDAGTRMLVSADACLGTIGGGHLEFKAVDIAHQLLASASTDVRVERFPLGARVGQCCGGLVYLSFEYIPEVRPGWVSLLGQLRHAGQGAVMVNSLETGAGSSANASASSRLIVTEDSCLGELADTVQHQLAVKRALELLKSPAAVHVVQEGKLLFETLGSPLLQFAVFGAGHVGKALVHLFSSLSCQVHWFDSREDQFPKTVPDNVSVNVVDTIECEVDELQPGTFVVVMTHSHALDLAICERMLKRSDLGWCGLIGSVSKRRQFEKRLIACGVSESSLAKLVCPIGIDGISGKQPAQIAVAVTAQLLLAAQSDQSVNVSESVVPESLKAKR